jgi:hypothetical protein
VLASGDDLHISGDGTTALLLTHYIEGGHTHSVVTTVDLVNSRTIGTPITINDDTLSVTSNADKTVFLIQPAAPVGPVIVDLAGHSITPALHNSAGQWQASFSADGKYLYFSDFKHLITEYAITPTGFQEVGVITLPDNFFLRSPLVLGPDGSRGIELGDDGAGGNNALRVIDLTVPTQPTTVPAAGNPILGLLNLIESVFDDQTPTLSPVQHRLDTANGVIVGNLGGHDAEGDKLTYTVTTAPQHGTVTIDQATGTWTYTRTDGQFGDDVFTVEATDGPGFHIHGLATLLTPGGGYTTMATVHVSDPAPLI